MCEVPWYCNHMENSINHHISVEAFRPGDNPRMVRYDLRMQTSDGSGKVRSSMALSTPRFKAAERLLELGLSKAFVNGVLTQARIDVGREIDIYV